MTVCAHSGWKHRGWLWKALRRAMLAMLLAFAWPAMVSLADAQPPDQRERERDRRDRDDADDSSRAELKKRFEARAGAAHRPPQP